MRGPCVNGAASVAEERDRAVVVAGCVATAAPLLFVAAGTKAAADAAASKKVVQPSFISVAKWYLINRFSKIRSKATMRPTAGFNWLD